MRSQMRCALRGSHPRRPPPAASIGWGTMSDGEVAIEATVDEQEARDHLVVLAAAGIAARLEQRTDGWVVVVPAVEAGRSRAAIADYLAELAAPSPGDLEWGPTSVGVLMAVLLVVAGVVTG